MIHRSNGPVVIIMKRRYFAGSRHLVVVSHLINSYSSKTHYYSTSTDLILNDGSGARTSEVREPAMLLLPITVN